MCNCSRSVQLDKMFLTVCYGIIWDKEVFKYKLDRRPFNLYYTGFSCVLCVCILSPVNDDVAYEVVVTINYTGESVPPFCPHWLTSCTDFCTYCLHLLTSGAANDVNICIWINMNGQGCIEMGVFVRWWVTMNPHDSFSDPTNRFYIWN